MVSDDAAVPFADTGLSSGCRVFRKPVQKWRIPVVDLIVATSHFNPNWMGRFLAQFLSLFKIGEIKS
jgi:hypothetical protein